MLILQAVVEPYPEALKEEYIGHDSVLPTHVITYLQGRMSKVTKHDKAAGKREIFIMWEQPMVLSLYFKKIGEVERLHF